ncbi:MAG TPA: HtaA domain-containing protein [Conexibacter sp.]|nr:HtaA domain-containing protein [Conexibacter sp.]
MPAAATALAVLAAAAAPHGTTTIAFDGPLAARLRAQGVVLARQAALPVARGRLGGGAALELRGRVTLRAGRGRSAARLTLRGWRAELRAGRATLSAVAGGRRRTLLVAAPPLGRLRLDPAAGAARLRPTGVRLTRAGARLLHARLAVAASADERLGTLRVRAALGPASGGTGGSGNGGGGGTGGGGTRTPPPGCTPGFSSGTIPPAPAPLARPAGALDVTSATLTWRPRASFVQYINSGEGTIASDGATAGPPETAPGSSARLVYSFGFELKAGSWYDPVGGGADLLGRGTVRFLWRDHGIDVTLSDPEVELNGRSSRAIFVFSGGDCTQISPVRGVMLDLAPGSPTVNGTTREYGTIPATITDAGVSMFSGFYLPGDPWGSFAVAFEAAP